MITGHEQEYPNDDLGIPGIILYQRTLREFIVAIISTFPHHTVISNLSDVIVNDAHELVTGYINQCNKFQKEQS